VKQALAFASVPSPRYRTVPSVWLEGRDHPRGSPRGECACPNVIGEAGIPDADGRSGLLGAYDIKLRAPRSEVRRPKVRPVTSRVDCIIAGMTGRRRSPSVHDVNVGMRASGLGYSAHLSPRKGGAKVYPGKLHEQLPERRFRILKEIDARLDT